MSTDRNGQLNQENAADRILTTSIPLRKPFEGSSPSAYDLRKQPAHEARSQYIKRNSRSHTNQPEHCASDPWRIEGKDFTGSLQIPGKTFSFNQREDWHSGKEEDYVKASQPIWSLGLYFNPDITFYPSDNLSNGLNYSLQVLPKLCFNQWYLQSGIGLRTGGDRGDLHINYNKYLGSYEDVYEVTFDSTANGVIPTYHTQAVDVYDTLPYYSVAESKVSFAYLDMPLLVGREWKLNKVSFYLHAGPAFSVLLGRSSPQPDYPEENIRILNESPQIPAREQFNWQIVAGAGLNYSLDEKISLSLEPTFRYYLTQDYDKHSLNTRHPYSFGVRAGLIYRINH
jgi:hypothetical protein